MEWVEASGKSLAEAKDAVLDLLGVAEDDAEFVVLAEPKAGLFGRMRGEARVQARVRPVTPPPKRGRRQRSDRRRGDDGAKRGTDDQVVGDDGVSTNGAQQNGSGGKRQRSGAPGRERSGTKAADVEAAADEPVRVSAGGGAEPQGGRRRSRGSGGRSEQRNGQRGAQGEGPGNGPEESEQSMESSLTMEEQGEAARGFVAGLVDAFGVQSDVAFRQTDEETVEVSATGQGLGLLVGPRGATLAAIQDLTRTFVQRQSEDRTGRIVVDIAGYREKRNAALQRFTEGIAAEVRESGEERALEPMSAADRKVVHDTANAIEGIATRSEGDDPRRYVVIEPA